MSLIPPKSKNEGVQKSIEQKMSKSNPASAIFMTDTKEEIKDKFKKAYCPEGQIKDNPVLEYCEYIIFEKIEKFVIERSEKFGGEISFKNYSELELAFKKKQVHPLDLKKASAKYLNEFLEPIRNYFKSNKKARELLKQVEGFQVTR